MSETSNRPVHTARHGQVKAAIWRNEGKNGPFYRVTFSRSYQDEDGWHDSDSFGAGDLWAIGLCAGEAYVWMAQEGRDQSVADAS